MSAEDVIGSTTYQDIAEGRILVSGTMTGLFDSATLRDLFLNETEFSIVAFLPVSPSSTADFVCVTLPRCKAGGADLDDGDKSLIRSVPFTALYNSAGGAGVSSEQTTDPGQPGMTAPSSRRCSSRARRGGRGARAEGPGDRRADRLEDPPARRGRAVAAGAAARAPPAPPRADREERAGARRPGALRRGADRDAGRRHDLAGAASISSLACRSSARRTTCARPTASAGSASRCRLRSRAAQIFCLGPRAPPSRSRRTSSAWRGGRPTAHRARPPRRRRQARRQEEPRRSWPGRPAPPAPSTCGAGSSRSTARAASSGFGLNPIATPSSRPTAACRACSSAPSRSTVLRALDRKRLELAGEEERARHGGAQGRRRQDLDRIVAQFNAASSDAVPKATYRAINRAVDKTVTETSREVRKLYNLKDRAVKAAMKKRYANRARLFGEVLIEGVRIPLIEFDARWTRRMPGASVKIKLAGGRASSPAASSRATRAPGAGGLCAQGQGARADQEPALALDPAGGRQHRGAGCDRPHRRRDLREELRAAAHLPLLGL
jgi:hypothetical protein